MSITEAGYLGKGLDVQGHGNLNVSTSTFGIDNSAEFTISTWAYLRGAGTESLNIIIQRGQYVWPYQIRYEPGSIYFRFGVRNETAVYYINTDVRDTILNINDLYKSALTSPKLETQLINTLTERFKMILQHRVKDEFDREDILQETMLAIIKKYKDVEFQVSFSAWAYKVLENNLLYYYRTEATAKRKKQEIADNKLQPSIINSDPMIKHKLLNCFKKLTDVNSRYADIIAFHYQGYKIEEICTKMKVSPNNAYIILSRGRSMLRNCLEKGELS